MVIVMGTDSGVRETGSADYDDEILDAGWLPFPDLQLQQAASSAQRVRKPAIAVDPDEFLRSIYRLQE